MTWTVVMSSADGPDNDLVGNYITGSGPLGNIDQSAPDQEVLTRLKLRPTFIGIERRVLKASIEAEPGTLANLHRGTVQPAPAPPIDPARGAMELAAWSSDLLRTMPAVPELSDNCGNWPTIGRAVARHLDVDGLPCDLVHTRGHKPLNPEPGLEISLNYFSYLANVLV